MTIKEFLYQVKRGIEKSKSPGNAFYAMLILSSIYLLHDHTIIGTIYLLLAIIAWRL